MSKFKVGDKVRCIDADNTDHRLTVGYVYEVLNDEDGYVSIRDNECRGGWSNSRFELVEPAKEAPANPTTTLTEDEQEFRRKIILTLLKRGANVDQVVHMAQTIIDECRKRGA